MQTIHQAAVELDCLRERWRNKPLRTQPLTQEERERIALEHTPERGRVLLKAAGFTTYTDENGIEQTL